MAIALTGANGSIGGVVRNGVRGRHDDVRLVDRTVACGIQRGEHSITADIRDIDAMRTAFEGCSTVVHLAGIPDEADFYDLAQSNILGTYTVFEAAKRARVKRIVYASSNHVVGFHSAEAALDANAALRPDSFYGVSKVFGEGLGRLYHDKWGLEIVCLRIGSFREKPQSVRQLSTWLGHYDAVELFNRAIEAEPVSFTVLYGVSANARCRWNSGEAAEALGFYPVQNAEDFRGEVEALPDLDPPQCAAFHGGAFTGTDYRGA